MVVSNLMTERQEKANVVEEQTQSHEEDQQERSEALMKQQEESDKVKEDEEEQKRKLGTLRKQHDRMGDHNEASKEQSGDQHRIPKTNRNLMENGNQGDVNRKDMKKEQLILLSLFHILSVYIKTNIWKLCGKGMATAGKHIETFLLLKV